MEDDRHTNFMKLYTFVVNYGYPHIIDAVKKKYKKSVNREVKKERMAKLLQKHVM